ncbi:Transcriptional regulatory protein LiaR [compost metagenome]
MPSDAVALAGVAPNASRRPVEPLSERERDVLGLLAQAMPNKKIALALGLSIDTVKWHLKNIYGKLGVSGRDEAVAWMRGRQE